MHLLIPIWDEEIFLQLNLYKFSSTQGTYCLLKYSEIIEKTFKIAIHELFKFNTLTRIPTKGNCHCHHREIKLKIAYHLTS